MKIKGISEDGEVLILLVEAAKRRTFIYYSIRFLIMRVLVFGILAARRLVLDVSLNVAVVKY